MIKIAVMADIHSNYEAFKVCVEDAINRGVEEFVFLGDYLGDMAQPQKTLQLLYNLMEKYPCTCIRGNKEEYWINHRRNKSQVWTSGNTSTGMLKYNYDRLSESDIDFFESMPISKIVHRDGFKDFTICHGSPFKVNQSMREDYGNIDELMKDIPTDLIICGHFHIQTDYIRMGKRIINPGAVGVSLHKNGKACYMILHGEDGTWSPEFISLNYDRLKTLQTMKDEKLDIIAPSWYKITHHLISTGEVSHAVVVNEVMEIYGDKDCKLSDIPDEVWDMAMDVVFNQ